MGRGSNHSLATNGRRTSRLVFGKTRRNTRKLEQAFAVVKPEEQVAMDAFTALGGKVTINDRGTRTWSMNGQLHRENGPAIERANGSREWYNQGMHHRADGPAIIRADGSQEWWYNNRPHRMSGPALDPASGPKEWWIDGHRYNDERQWRQDILHRDDSAR